MQMRYRYIFFISLVISCITLVVYLFGDILSILIYVALLLIPICTLLFLFYKISLKFCRNSFKNIQKSIPIKPFKIAYGTISTIDSIYYTSCELYIYSDFIIINTFGNKAEIIEYKNIKIKSSLPKQHLLPKYNERKFLYVSLPLGNFRIKVFSQKHYDLIVSLMNKTQEVI